MKWDPRPSASATHRQTGWGLYHHQWSNDACTALQRQPRLELAWVCTDFLSEQRRTADFVETAGRAGGKWQPAPCSSKDQNKFSIPFMAKKLLHLCIGAHAQVHVHFLRRVCMNLDRCCEHHACAGVYVRQVLWTSAWQRTHLCTRSLQDVHMRSCMCSLFIQRWGTRMGGSN